MISIVLGTLDLEVLHENRRVRILFVITIIDDKHKDLIINMLKIHDDQITNAVILSKCLILYISRVRVE